MNSPPCLHPEDAELVSSRPRKRQKSSNPDDLRMTHDSYTVAWICALPIEMAAAQAVLDEFHESLSQYPNDHNAYVLGSIAGHNVVIACLPSNQYGIVNAANVVTNLTRTFTAIRVGLMVGIGGGVPSKVDLRLGDIVVGTRVMQPDLGKIVGNGELERTAIPRFPHQSLNTALSLLRARHELDGSKVPSIIQQMLEGRGFGRPRLPDRLFQAEYSHSNPQTDCDMCDQTKLVARSTRTSKDPLIHYGAIASGNQVIKDSTSRDQIARQLNVICFEMEAAGLMDVLPCLPIRGICDYCDSHKSKEWQKYAAATAAAYARELLGVISITETHNREANTRASGIDPQSSLQGKRQSLLDSLRFEQINARESSIKNAHTKTCQWILTHSEYKAWLDPTKLTDHHGFLWIKGKPGAGKSTIMKYVYLKMREKTCPRKAIASFFFNARGEYLERAIVGMYRSLLLQLLECYPDLQAVLDHSESLPNHRQNAIHSLDVLKELLGKAILMLGQRPFTCFIDALDECDEQQVLDMIQFFEEIAEKSTAQKPPLRICFSSRHYPYIIIRWGSRIILEHQQGHTEDLEAYVCSTLRARESEVIEKILHKAAGVFMWVALVVQILNREYSRGAMFIHQRLEELPSNLSDLFRDILKRDNENMEELLLCFLWILCAERPLGPEEFYHALWSGLSPDGRGDIKAPDASVQDASDNLPRAYLYVISSSKGLAEVTGSTSNKIVQFIHESVRDFLIKDRGLYELWPELGLDWESPSHDRLKHCCSVYLSWAYKRGSTTRHGKAHRYAYGDEGDSKNLHFLEYACQSILYHANAASQTFSQDQFISSFDLSSWICVHNLFEKYAIRYYTPKAKIVYILADKGYPELIRAVLKRDPQAHFEAGKERYSYPLFAALARGDKASVAALLDLPSTICDGEDITEGLDKRKDLGDHKNLSPLSWAIANKRTGLAKFLIPEGMEAEDMDRRLLEAVKNGNEIIVGLLLDRGASLNGVVSEPALLDLAFQSRAMSVVECLIMRGADFSHLRISVWTRLLQDASDAGHEAMIKILVEREGEMDINSPNIVGLTALHKASTQGSEAIVKLLLDHGSDVNTSDNLGQTALHKASTQGSETIVKLLLDHGSDVNTSDNLGQTALHKASMQGSETIVKLLLDHGSDVNIPDGVGQTALYKASMQSSETIVKLLLDHGSDVNISDQYGQTPLHEASIQCSETIVKLLLDHRSDVNIPDGVGQTALHKASSTQGSETIVKLLLDHGSDVNISDQYGQTPLHEASIQCSETIVKLLLDHGSNVNISDGLGQSALYKASMQGSETVVKLLLDYGSDVHIICDGLGQTPLHEASIQCSEATVKLLLDYGSDVNISDGLGQTALHKASSTQGSETIVKLLLDYGSDVNISDRIGQTALHKASSTQGSETIVKILLDHGSNVKATDHAGRIPLHLATDYASARLLIDRGSNSNTADTSGCIPLHCVLLGNFGHAIVKLLLDNGSDVHASDNFGQMPLHYSAQWGGDVAVKLLLDLRPDPNVYDCHRKMPLHYALASGTISVARLLLEHGADPNFPDNSGQMPLCHSIERGNNTVVKLLLEHGADPNIPNLSGQLPISRAARQDVAILKLLLDHGADVNAPDRDGLVPLVVALCCGKQASAQLLLDNGADVRVLLNNLTPGGAFQSVTYMDGAVDIRIREGIHAENVPVMILFHASFRSQQAE